MLINYIVLYFAYIYLLCHCNVICVACFEGVRVMVLNATFNNISVVSRWSVLFVEETGIPGKKPPTCRESLTNFITYYCIEYTSSEQNSNSQL